MMWLATNGSRRVVKYYLEAKKSLSDEVTIGKFSYTCLSLPKLLGCELYNFWSLKEINKHRNDKKLFVARTVTVVVEFLRLGTILDMIFPATIWLRDIPSLAL